MVFLRWLRGLLTRDTRRVSEVSPPGGKATLRALVGCPSRLPTLVARQFGLGDGASVGELIGLLEWAQHHPAGPRCRTPRSAVYFLARRAGLTVGSWRGGRQRSASGSHRAGLDRHTNRRNEHVGR